MVPISQLSHASVYPWKTGNMYTHSECYSALESDTHCHESVLHDVDIGMSCYCCG